MSVSGVGTSVNNLAYFQNMSDKIIENKDTDGDSKLNVEEFAKNKDVFTKIDMNGDDFIDRKELVYNNPTVRQNRILSNIIDTKDADGDGLLSSAESGKSEEKFARIDKNNDGLVDVKEMSVQYRRDQVNKTTVSMIDTKDENGDAMLSADELGGRLEIFSRIDSNNDKQVDNRELNAFYPQAETTLSNLAVSKIIDRYDEDNNGLLTAAEVGATDDDFSTIDLNNNETVEKIELTKLFQKGGMEYLSQVLGGPVEEESGVDMIV